MDYKKFTDLIIANIEGGYYHPDMKDKLKNGERMGISGETLFGMDRVNGGNLMKTPTGLQFWALVDSIYSDKHANTSYYNHKPTGATGAKLRALACELMKGQYEKYTQQYLSAESRRLVNSSKRLQLHFFYACWNGPVAFEYYAKAINSAVAAGTRSESDLLDVAYNSRKRYISQSAEPVKKVWDLLGSGGGRVWPWLLLAAGLTALAISRKD